MCLRPVPSISPNFPWQLQVARACWEPLTEALTQWLRCREAEKTSNTKREIHQHRLLRMHAVCSFLWTVLCCYAKSCKHVKQNKETLSLHTFKPDVTGQTWSNKRSWWVVFCIFGLVSNSKGWWKQSSFSPRVWSLAALWFSTAICMSRSFWSPQSGRNLASTKNSSKKNKTLTS